MSQKETPNPFLGRKFGSFEELKKFIESWESETKQKFSIMDSRTIEAAKTRVKRYLKDDLVYYTVTYVCIHGGGPFKSKGKGIRKSSTFKMGCPFKVRFMVSKDGKHLEIVSSCFTHEGHGLSEKVYEHLPQVRKLNENETEEIVKYFEVGGNTKIIHNKIMLEQDKKVTLKDLNNIKYRLKQDSNDLQQTIKLLKEDYKADVAILQDEDKNFKAMYFSTEDMRSSMASFPEIVFIDGTYKLLNNGLTLMLLVVEDSNGLSEVAGVCLLLTEDYDTFKWFLTHFKNVNETASTSIRCFMADKDLLQRNVIKEIFEGVPVYICLFHTLKTFKRQITTEKFKIDKSEKENCLELLTKLAYSHSEESYNDIYNVFVDTCPPDVVHYFNQNWHNIRSEWTCHSMTQGNLKNRTNNRLESLNQKIKAVVPLNSSLCLFFKHFLNWLRSHNEERNTKVAQLILKRPISLFSEHSCEKKYLDFLTPYASSHVLVQCDLSKKVTITEASGMYKVSSAGKGISVTILTCECPNFLSMLLPCRHILSLRRYLNMPLFCEEICDKRWRKSVYLKSHRVVLGEAHTDIPLSCTLTNVPTSKVMNTTEKRKRANLIANSLVNLTTLSSNSQFEYKLNCLKKLEEFWRQGYEVNITKCDTSGNSENERSDSSPIFQEQIVNQENFNTDPPSEENRESEIDISNYNCDSHDTISIENKDLSSIIMPYQIKRKGRPKGSELTVVGLNKKKKNQK